MSLILSTLIDSLDIVTYAPKLQRLTFHWDDLDKPFTIDQDGVFVSLISPARHLLKYCLGDFAPSLSST